jgi:hypothetical protein
MCKYTMEIRSIINPATVADIVINIPLLQWHVRDPVLGRPAGPRVIVSSLPKDEEIYARLAGQLLAIASDHHVYISFRIDRGDEIDLQDELARVRASEDLAYAMMSRATAVSIEAKWSVWLADDLERLASDFDDDDNQAAAGDAARVLAATIISCIETQGFSYLLVRAAKH